MRQTPITIAKAKPSPAGKRNRAVRTARRPPSISESNIPAVGRPTASTSRNPPDVVAPEKAAESDIMNQGFSEAGSRMGSLKHRRSASFDRFPETVSAGVRLPRQ